MYEHDFQRTKENASLVDATNVTSIVKDIDQEDAKILVAAPSTKIIFESLSQTDMMKELNNLGYIVMHITSKYGAFINKTKVSREVFFKRLNEYGADKNQKIIVFHHSILGEGINVTGLTHCIMLRNLPTIEMLQTIGRVTVLQRKIELQSVRVNYSWSI